jgi:hypothetical protein
MVVRSHAPKRIQLYNLYVLLERHGCWFRRQLFGTLLFLTLLLGSLTQSGCAALSTSTGLASADPAPSIFTQPTNRTVTAGQTATFSVVASGTAPFSYQWRKNGTAVSGATSSSYTSPPETASNSGAKFTVVVSNSAGSATSRTAILTVNAAPPGAPLQIETSLFPTAEVGVQFRTVLSATGGVQPYHWRVVSKTFPAALWLNSITGALSGTASHEGQFDFSVQVSDSSSLGPETDMRTLVLSVVLAALQIAPGGLPNGQVGVPYQASLSGSGGVPPYTWNVGGAPALGLGLNATSGVIAGTPTQVETSTFTVVLTDSEGRAAQKSSSIAIAAAGTSASGPIITPSVPPTVNQGATFQFTANAAGTWSCSGTDSTGAPTVCKGSISPVTGLYTAPATVTAQQSVGGYQLLPNNHIYNTNISAFSVNSNSATWLAAIAGSTTSFFHMPINYGNASTPTESQVFYYTPANNGTFEIPASPGVWPTEGRIEGGWISAITNQNSDHHLLLIDTTTGNMQDMYQYHPAGTGGSACEKCTSQSGVKYTTASYTLPANGATDAAGMYITPLLLRLQELERAVATSGTINHALRMTVTQFGTKCPQIWPATQCANNGGSIPFGARLRLKSSFNISRYSTAAQIVLTAMKNYGMFVVDGGQSLSIGVEDTKWPNALNTALVSISGIAVSNFEFVDESGYEISSTSGDCSCNQETVVFTRTSDGITGSTDVVLTGVAVNFPYDLVQIQVGSPAYQFTALANIGSVTYTMSPSVGTLNSTTGLYTPPTSVSVPTAITVRATSTTNSAVAASLTLNVFPAGVIRLVPGSVPVDGNYEMNPTTYTDTSSNNWYSIGDNGGYAYDQCNSISGTSDPQLYCWEYAAYDSGGNDVRFDFIVPNGTYQILCKAASTFGTLGTQIQDLELNGTILYPNLDLYAVSGGHDIAWDWATSVNITNNKLSFVLRIINNNGTHLGALQISH